MEHKRILTQTPGKTIYAGTKEGEVYHCFTDTYYCPLTQQTVDIPGKGAISHRLSTFFFSKLHHLGVPTHFIRTINLRESLMYATETLPFDLRIRCVSSPCFSKDFGTPEGKIFDSPMVEFIHKDRILSESMIMALEWMDLADLDQLQTLTLKIVDYLRGMFMGVGLNLMELTLTMGRGFEDDFFLAGAFSPETFCVKDVESGELWSMPFDSPQGQPAWTDASCAVEKQAFLRHYQTIARRFGIYLGGPRSSCIIPFPSLAHSRGS
jgi:phosphoribosylaminoimidazole-succinocarboxamide synthase